MSAATFCPAALSPALFWPLFSVLLGSSVPAAGNRSRARLVARSSRRPSEQLSFSAAAAAAAEKVARKVFSQSRSSASTSRKVLAAPDYLEASSLEALARSRSRSQRNATRADRHRSARKSAAAIVLEIRVAENWPETGRANCPPSKVIQLAAPAA